MAGVVRGRAGNEADSAANLITTNGANENDAPRVRQADSDLGASAPNFVDDNLETKSNGGFGSTVPSDQTDPTEFAYVGYVDSKIVTPSLEFYMNSDDTVSGGVMVRAPIIIDDSSEVLSGNLLNAYYEVSFDAEVWIEPNGTTNSTITDLKNWIIANITVQPFYVRSYTVYNVGEFGEGIVNFNY